MNRYNAIKTALEVGMDTFPHLRLGQLISNAVPEGKDLFYLTDTELLTALWAYIREHGK